jgi:type VI secretion system secreted protein VgrG
MATFIQENRIIGVETSLGTDKLLLLAFSGEERLSGLFRFELRMLSEDGGIKASDIVGKPIDFYVRDQNDEKRYFNGIVNRFSYSGQDDRAHYYSAEVVPWMWLLTKASDCRVHETEKSKDAKDIINGLLNELGLSDFKWDVKRPLEKREYCVQFRETHYQFVTRLLEEEGIYFYFRHEQGKHELYFTDHINGVYDCKDAKVQMLSNLSQREDTDNLRGWHHQYEYTSGKYSLTDYNFEDPSTSLLLNKNSLVSLQDNSKFEFYEYPGFYVQKGVGDSLLNLRMEAEEARHNTVSGNSECRWFSPGARFGVEKHHAESEKGGKWVLTRVVHNASLSGNYLSGASHEEESYQNEFQCLPSDVVYRPPFQPRVGVDGLQTAVVTGPPGEEIYTDNYGRVKVQFPWDRLGKKDDKSSFWVRVSQVHAGQGWGMMDLPRIGEEVLISFLDGNPDRPIIIGRVYNGDNSPPFALPGEKTRRGNTTKSYKSSGANELSMDDTAGKEQLRINAQYDMDTNVNNNQTLNVGVDRTNTIGANESIEIGADQTIVIGANQKLTISSNQTLEVGGNQDFAVDGSRAEKISGDEAFELGGKQDLTIGADQTISVGGKQTSDIGSDMTLFAGGKIQIEAGMSIELIVGSSTIKIDATGVEIKGAAIKIEGTATASMKSPNTSVEGDATLTLMGGMTKIN